MWFEVLPSIGVIFTAMTLGCYATGWVPAILLNRPCYRELDTGDQLFAYQRDRRLTGHAYTMQGLEQIPDEDNATSGTSGSCKK